MSLLEPTVETFAVLVIVLAILVEPNYDGLSLGVLLFVLSLLVMVRYIRSREWGWGTAAVAMVVAYVMITNQIEPFVLVPGVGLWFLARLGLVTLRWYAYEVRYLTSRRIIETTGFFGLRVASMPVTRVTDLVLSHTAVGEIFKYGELRIESAGEDQALSRIRFLVEPGSFHRIAVRLATKPSKIEAKRFIDIDPNR